jgi:diguanylate cyclase (GGDEF)-like protein
LLRAFWWLVLCGVLLTAPIFGAELFTPSRWGSSGVTHIFAVAGWGFVGWQVSRRNQSLGVQLFLMGLMPFIAFSTASGTTAVQALNLSVSSRIALMGPLELMMGVLGGAITASLGLLIVALSFWGADFSQAIITGHQLVLYGIFGTLVHGLLRDLERRHDTLEAVNARLEGMALRDAATGLANRRALETEFGRYRRAGEPVAFAMWDLDGLKRVNDSQGHAAGDRLLKQFADALRVASSDQDRLYRIGGDEFVSLHPNMSSLGLLIDRVRAAFPEVSVGWVQLGDHSLDAALLEADALMYADKQTRRAGIA